MAEVTLAGGEVCLVDEGDLPLVEGMRWRVLRISDRHLYAVHGKNSTLMHRVIMEAGLGQYVDHINGNTLDNRRANLRLCTRRQNLRNRCKSDLSNQPYKGISKIKRGGRWHARIRVNGNRFSLGSFETPEQAAMAYDDAAVKHFGEFACLNFPHRYPGFSYRKAG